MGLLICLLSKWNCLDNLANSHSFFSDEKEKKTKKNENKTAMLSWLDGMCLNVKTWVSEIGDEMNGYTT